MRVAAIILAAGSSKRLGEPKQSTRLGSETLLERVLRIAATAGLDPVFAVVTSELAPILNWPARIVINEDAAEGMASSIRMGIAAAIEAQLEAVIILACDQPFITADHLRQLASGGSEIVASLYAGRKGVPAYFPASAFRNLLDLRGDIGARELLRTARAVPLKKGELDVDTAEDLKRARELEASQPQS